MQITREKLIAMWGLINRLAMEKTNVRFHYLILKNKRLLEDEVKALQEAQQPPTGLTVFEEERMALCKTHCVRDEAGAPVEENNNFIIQDETKEVFDKELKELQTKHKEVLDAVEANRGQFMELLKEEIELDFSKIPMSVMPESILGGDVDLLFDLIDEDK